MFKILTIAIKSLACLIIISVGSYVIVAQSTITGTWDSQKGNQAKHKEKLKDNKGEYDYQYDSEGDIHLNFRYETSQGGKNSHGVAFRYDDLEGLTRVQVESASSAVRFRIVREAGVIECSGTFESGRGSGAFNFVPNNSFSDAMRSRGFEFNNEKMFSAAMLDLTVSLADDLVSSGFQNLTTNDLFKAKIFRVDSTFMREMAATGFPNLDMEDLVKARIFKIDTDFVRDVVVMGFATKSFEELVKMRIFKITPEFLRDMQTAGFSRLNSEQAVKLRIFKVTPDFIREMQGQGLDNLTVEQAVKLRIFKVDGNFIRKAKVESSGPLGVEELVQLKIRGKIK